MTNEEAIKILSYRDSNGIPCGYAGGMTEALDMAINALSNQVICPSYNVDCTDCPAYKPCKAIKDIKADIKEQRDFAIDCNGESDLGIALKIIDNYIGEVSE